MTGGRVDHLFANYLPSYVPVVDVPAFKHAMGSLAGAVSVITVGTFQYRTGFTATSVSSYSVETPTILVSQNRTSSSWPALLEAGSFAVNILAEVQSDVADCFAGRGGITSALHARNYEFGTMPIAPLPFPALVVACRSTPTWLSTMRWRRLAPGLCRCSIWAWWAN